MGSSQRSACHTAHAEPERSKLKKKTTYFSAAFGFLFPLPFSQPQTKKTAMSSLLLRSLVRPRASWSATTNAVMSSAAVSSSLTSSFASLAAEVYPEGNRPAPAPHEIIPGVTGSFRTGVIAMKAGMTAEFDDWGVRHALTVLAVENCQVVQTKSWVDTLPNGTKRTRYQTQVGSGFRKEKHTSKPLQGHFKRAGVEFKRHLCEFPVTEDAVLPDGTELTARHFVPGQRVDVVGVGIGKGFQGAMKRHGFAGQGATHGATKSHRSIGGTGGCQDPGKVFKGKKMAGRMGGKQITQQSLEVYKVDTERNLIFVKGSVPGNKGGTVKINDTKKWWKKSHSQLVAAKSLPFPTFFVEDSHKDDKSGVLVKRPPVLDPLDYSTSA